MFPDWSVQCLYLIYLIISNLYLIYLSFVTEFGDVNTCLLWLFMRTLLDKHAPLKTIQVVERPMNDWINDDILELKIIRR